MAFNVSYRNILDKNIKHIYSLSNTGILFRRPQPYRPLADYRVPSIKRKFPKRFYEYYPEWNIGLPRAPAFREMSQDYVDRMVERICRPAVCKSSKTKKKRVTFDNSCSKVYGNQKVAADEMNAITRRLLKKSKCKKKQHKQQEQDCLVLPPLKI